MNKEGIVKYLEDQKETYRELYEAHPLPSDINTSYYTQWVCLKQILEHIKK